MIGAAAVSGKPFGYLLGVGNKPALLHAGDRLTFGRDPQNNFSFDDALLSRTHASITVAEDGSVTLQDLNSTNFTWLNDEQIKPNVPLPMKSGDSFRIGGQVMTYIANDADLHPVEAGLQKKVRMATMETIVIQKPHFEEEQDPEQAQASTRLHQPIIPLGASKVTKDTQVRPSAASAQPVSLEGNLKDHMFPQLLQYLHTARKTGDLVIDGEGDRGQAIIGFQEGKILFAQLGDDLGIAAVNNIARWKEGTFQFKSLPQLTRPKNVVHPTMTIVLKCCQIMDEEGK